MDMGLLRNRIAVCCSCTNGGTLVGADSYIRPNALCLHNLNRHAPHNDHLHESNCKQYCMLRQYIAGGYMNPPLPVVREINRCKHDATTPSGCACHPSIGGELAVAVLFQQSHTTAIASHLYPAAQPDGVVARYGEYFFNSLI